MSAIRCPSRATVLPPLARLAELPSSSHHARSEAGMMFPRFFDTLITTIHIVSKGPLMTSRTPAERRTLIESYGKAHDELLTGLKKYPKEMWGFKPSEGWSIHEIICHIADSEANSYVRCRRFIAEPGLGVYGYDTDKWADATNYASQDVDEMIDLFRALRRNSYLLIKGQPDSVWSNTVEHSESGTMHFDGWLDIYERHVREHLKQMDDVYQEWVKSRS
jgi:hypothetical protein